MATTLTAQPTASSDSRLLAWIQANRRLLLIGAGVVLAVLLVGWFLVTARGRREEFANRALNQAQAIAESGNIPVASTELQKVIDTYSGTEAAVQAEISLNQLRLISGQSELAIVRLREFAGKGLAPRYAAAAQALLGAALENVGRPAEAAAAYQAASEAAPQDYLKADYLLQAARAWAAGGKDAEAATALRTLLEKYPDSPVKIEAQVRLAELTKGQM